MKFKVSKEYDVDPDAVLEIADAMLEWMDAHGWRPKYEGDGKEPKAPDGDELSYREMAQMFVDELSDREV